MKIDELDEYQLLTREMVDSYLNHKGWCNLPDPEIRLLKPSYVQITFSMGLVRAVEQIAEIEGRTVQALLREINPRMRKGMPSQAARKAHVHTGGVWIASRGKLGDGGTIVFVCLHSESDTSELTVWQRDEWETWDIAPGEIENWFFWPSDDFGNKVRWPERNGVML